VSTTVVINEVPKFNLSVQQGDGPAVTLSQPDAPALTLSMSGPQGPTGPAGAAGPNSVTSATTSDGTGILSLSSLSLSTPLPLASGGTGGATASTARTNLGLGTADTPTFSNLSLNTGTITVPQPMAFTQTWNSTATFSAFQMNITDSGSANAASLLMDLRVGGVSRFRISSGGGFYSASLCQIGTTTTPYWQATGSESGAMTLGASYGLAWRSQNAVNAGSNDLVIHRDAASTLAQRNGLAAQEFRLYGTYTDASNYERLKLKATGTAFQIGTEKLGATTVARPLQFQTDGTTRMTIDATGVVSVAAAGSATNPSLNFGDAGTGIYKQTTDRIGFTASSVLKVVVYSGGMYLNTGAAFGINTANWFRIGASGVELTTTAAGGTLAPLSLSTLTASGDVEVTDSTKGIILKSPDGTRYRIKVANGGTLSVSPA
jgi:hypothetical protein